MRIFYLLTDKHAVLTKKSASVPKMDSLAIFWVSFFQATSSAWSHRIQNQLLGDAWWSRTPGGKGLPGAKGLPVAKRLPGAKIGDSISDLYRKYLSKIRKNLNSIWGSSSRTRNERKNEETNLRLFFAKKENNGLPTFLWWSWPGMHWSAHLQQKRSTCQNFSKICRKKGT